MDNHYRLDFLVPLLNRHRRWVLYYLISIWWVSLMLFLLYWCRPEHIITWDKFIFNTILLLWMNLLPGYFFYFITRMKYVNPEIAIPQHWRVAMIATRAPSEPFDVVKETLLAMQQQTFPHDTWLADEDPTNEITTWCAQHGVLLSTRKGVAEYHQESWPRRTRCKEGNLAYFYDHYGYDQYDIVVQMDADHVPGRHYLEEMLRPFVNEAIGYVSAPSICDSNAPKSWAARGRLFSETILHGPLQAGYSDAYASLCIGSHYAVRTKALQAIGGLGPELAEDHSTTLRMHGHGWKGVHAIHALAHGEGPATLSDCITQEFQWSRSLMILLLTDLPRYWKRLSLSLKMQFLFSELWYPLFGLMFLLGTLLPVIAVVTDTPWVSVSFIEFLLYSMPTTISIIAVIWFLKNTGLFRPFNAPLISWEIVLFQILRWPWALYGSVMGLVAVIKQKTPVFKVTPKGLKGNGSLSWNILYPYIGLAAISALPGILIQHNTQAAGYHYFLIINVMTYVVLIFLAVILHHRENRT